MWLTLLAIACGLLVGWGCGGTIGAVRNIPITSWPLLAVGLIMWLVPEIAAVPLAMVWVAVAGCALIVFCLRNLKLIGLGVIGVGIALNLLVLLANSGVPVDSTALADARGAGSEVSAAESDLRGPRHIASSDDRFATLGDRIPVPAFGVVVSFGDLIVLVGLGDLVANLLLGRRQRLVVDAPGKPSEPRRRSPHRDADTPPAEAPDDGDRELVTVG